MYFQKRYSSKLLHSAEVSVKIVYIVDKLFDGMHEQFVNNVNVCLV